MRRYWKTGERNMEKIKVKYKTSILSLDFQEAKQYLGTSSYYALLLNPQ
jgi:hypothetical protein